MTPQEMVNAVRHATRAPEELWQRLNGLRKIFHNDEALASRALWEALAVNAVDLAEAPGWWELLGGDLASQPWDRVRAALDRLPALHTRAASEHQTVRGLAREFWSVSSFAEALVRHRAPEVLAALPALNAEAQSSCAAHLVLAGRWPDAPLPASLIARAAEGYVSIAHDEALHPRVREAIGDDGWWDAVAAALSRDGVKLIGLARLQPALSRCDPPMLFAALEGLARGQDDHVRAGAAALLDAAFARDEALSRKHFDALVGEVTAAAALDRSGTLPWDDARRHRVRRLSMALPVALARRAAARGEAPAASLDALMEEELNQSDNHDLELTREAFDAFAPERRAALVAKHLYTTRGLAVAARAMTPANVDAMIAQVLQWSPKYGGPADKVIEALSHGGDHARDALRAAAGNAGPHRAVFLRALGRFADASVASDLVRFAAGASKPERTAIAASLCAQGPHGVSAVEELLAAKKADLRELGVEVLKGLAEAGAANDAVRAMAKRFAGSERSAALRAELTALAERDAESAPGDDLEAQLVALAAAVPEGERAALRQAVLDTEGRVAETSKDLGPALLPYLLEWVRATGGDTRRYESYHPFLTVLLRHIDHPLAPRIAIAGLYALGEKKVHAAKGFVSALRLQHCNPVAWEKLPWTEAQARQKVIAAQMRQALIAQMAAALPTQREHALAWLAEAAPIEAAPAFVRALADTAKGLREQAVELLCEKVTPDDALAHAVAAHLGDAARTTRLAAATVLARWRPASVADAVKRALEREKQPEVAAVLQRALPENDAVGPAAPAISEATPAVEDDASLDARLAAEKSPRAPKWLDAAALPTLRWRGGAPLSPGAMKWFVAWLGQESEARHDEALLAVRRRLNDDDCAALCDAIRAQWRAGGSSKSAVEFVLLQQAVLGDEERLWELGSVQQQWYDGKLYKANQLAALALLRHGGYSALAWLERWAAEARGGQFIKAYTAAADAVSVQRKAPLEELVDLAVPAQGDTAQIVVWQLTRWELAMILGRRFPLAVWRAHFVEHPLLAAPARTLVFRAHPGGLLLQLDAKGEACDVEGRAVSLEELTEVEIAHPASLAEAEAKAWKMVPVSPPADPRDPQDPIAQRAREVSRAAPGGGDPFAARLGKGVSVQARRLAQRLRAGRFEPGDLIDGGSYGMGVRRVGRHWRVEVHHDGIPAQTSLLSASDKAAVRSVSLRRGDAWITPSAAPAGLVSEAMTWLEALLA
jgi:hypothetical protein